MRNALDAVPWHPKTIGAVLKLTRGDRSVFVDIGFDLNVELTLEFRADGSVASYLQLPVLRGDPGWSAVDDEDAEFGPFNSVSVEGVDVQAMHHASIAAYNEWAKNPGAREFRLPERLPAFPASALYQVEIARREVRLASAIAKVRTPVPAPHLILSGGVLYRSYDDVPGSLAEQEACRAVFTLATDIRGAGRQAARALF
jgi:hypothetical protein